MTKQFAFILALSISINFSFAQEKTINHTSFKINDLPLLASKDDIIRSFGTPRKIVEPKYECGFLSEAEQGIKFYSLQYNSFKFTRNKTDKYILEEAIFTSKSTLKITYKGYLLSHKTTKNDFKAIFGITPEGQEVHVRYTNSEDALLFIFKNNLLYKIEYWSPC